MIIALHEATAERGLATGKLTCPCGGCDALACAGCPRTHVVLPAAQLPRRVAHTDTISTAQVRAANGQGHRRIATELDLPAGTVRGWLRRFRARADILRGLVVNFSFRADPGFHPPPPERSPLTDAVAALGRRQPPPFGGVAPCPLSLRRGNPITQLGRILPGLRGHLRVRHRHST